MDAVELTNGIYEMTTTVVSDSCLYDGQPAEHPAPRQGAILTDGTVLQLVFGEPAGPDSMLAAAYTLEPTNDYHAHLDTNNACSHVVIDVTATELTATEIRIEKTNDYEIRCAADGLQPDTSCTTTIEQSSELLTACPIQCVTEDPASGVLHCCTVQ